MTYVSFPGLGISPFHINRVAFTVFGRQIAWYGIIICAAIIIAISLSIFNAKKSGIKTDDVIDIAFFVILFGVLGARLYYVIFEWNNYVVTGGSFWSNLGGTLRNIVAVWEGGLAIYGGIIAGFIVILVATRIKKISLLRFVDCAAPGCMIGQAMGRWGNFINAEAYGSETTLPWRMGLHESKTGVEGMWTSEKFVHPTFLYESLWNLVGFIIACVIFRKKKKDGMVFFFFLAWYGFGRMFIEGLRTDSLYFGPIRVSQLVGLLSCIAGIIGIAILKVRNKNTAYAVTEGAAVKEAEEVTETETAEETAEAKEEITEAETTEEPAEVKEEQTEQIGEPAPAEEQTDSTEETPDGSEDN